MAGPFQRPRHEDLSSMLDRNMGYDAPHFHPPQSR